MTEKPSLKALAHAVLQRDTPRDTRETQLSHEGETGTPHVRRGETAEWRRLAASLTELERIRLRVEALEGDASAAMILQVIGGAA